LESLAGVALPPEPVPSAQPPRIDASRYVGTYAGGMATVVISQHDDGAIWMDASPTGTLAEEIGEQPERWELVHLSDDTLVTRERDRGLHRPYVFLGDDGTGHARYLHVGRALTRSDVSADVTGAATTGTEPAR
jgi:hypothetical protein